MKKISKGVLSVGFAAIVAAGTGGHAQQRTFIYPAQGQTQAQQSTDEGQCYSWARQQTGYDPSAPSGGGTQTGGAVRGAAGGAIGGAVIGAIAGDAGKGAAIGAGVGAVGGGLRQRDANNQRANAQRQAVDDYNRAFQTCMEGRGYTIK